MHQLHPVHRVLAVFLVFVFLTPPSHLSASGPEWWERQGVLSRDADTGEFLVADDYAAINQGQLKNLATAARSELGRLPGGAGTNINDMVDAWRSAMPSTDDYAAVNLGQLKTVAAPFLSKLRDFGLIQAYPWEGKVPDDFAIANIGQAKNLFSFDLDADSDNDGTTDLQEIFLGSDLDDPLDTGNGSRLIEGTHALVPVFYNPAEGTSPRLVGAAGGGGTSVPLQMGAPGRHLIPTFVSLFSLAKKPVGIYNEYDEDGETVVKSFELKTWRASAFVGFDPALGATSYEIQQKDGDLGEWVSVAQFTRADLSNSNNEWESGDLLGGHRYRFRMYALNPKGKVLVGESELFEVPVDVTTDWKLVKHYSDGSSDYNYRFIHNKVERVKYPHYIKVFDSLPELVSGTYVDGWELDGFISGWSAEVVNVPSYGSTSIPASTFIVPDDVDDSYPYRGSGILAKNIGPLVTVTKNDGTTEDVPSGTTLDFHEGDVTDRSFDVVVPGNVTCSYDESRIELWYGSNRISSGETVHQTQASIWRSYEIRVKNMADGQVVPIEVECEIQDSDGSNFTETDVIKVRYIALRRDGQRPIDYRIPVDEVSGARYRKVGLNGRPLPDKSPAEQEETDRSREETFVDALTRTLRHSTTDIWSSIPGADLALAIRRNASTEIWSDREGLDPKERLFNAFGFGWRSSLDAHIRIVTRTGASGVYTYVTDADGMVHRFYDGLPAPTAGNEHASNLTSITRVADPDYGVCYDFVAPYGTKTRFQMFTTVGASRNPDVGEWHEFGRPLWIVDKLGIKLIYEYADDAGGKKVLPSRIYLEVAPERAITIKADIFNRVAEVWDPNGNHFRYYYDSTGGLPTLKDVMGPEGLKTTYSYDYSDEFDTRSLLSGELPNHHHHLNLGSITTYVQGPAGEKARTYTFNYTFDTSRKDRNFDQARHGPNLTATPQKYHIQLGSPRVLESIALPGCPNLISFSSTSDVWIAYGYDADTGLYAPTMPGRRNLVVTDAEGHVTTYEFTEPDVTQVAGIDTQNLGYAQNLIGYRKMTVKSAVGIETFSFDSAAGFSLCESVGLSSDGTSGNRTTYSFEVQSPDEAAPRGIFDLRFKTFLNANGTKLYVMDPGNYNSRYPDPTYEVHYLKKQDGTLHEVRTRFEYIRGSDPRLRGKGALLEKLTDPRGILTEYGIDPVGRRNRETVWGGQDEINGDPVPLQVAEFGYTNQKFPGVVTSRVLKRRPDDPAWVSDISTSYSLDKNGNIAGESVGGSTTFHTYDPCGNRLSTTNPNGHRTSFSYDGRNRLVEIGFPYAHDEGDLNGHSSSVRKEFSYDKAGNKTGERDERGNWTTWDYDDLNRVEAEHRLSDAGMMSTYYGYNWVNSRTSITDPKTIVTRFEYDGIQRLKTKITAYKLNGTTLDPKSRTTSYYYEDTSGGSTFDPSSSRPTRIVDPRGYEQKFLYDTLSRLTWEGRQYRKSTDEGGEAWAEINRGYDDAGNLDWETDPLSKTTDYEYDGLNRLITKVFADTTVNRIKYTGTGLVWQVEDEAGNRTETQYDSRGLPVRTISQAFPVLGPDMPDGEPVLTQAVTETEYDAAGNIIERRDAAERSWQYVFNPRNQKVAEFLPFVSILNGGTEVGTNPVLRWKYDEAGNVTEVTDARGKITVTEYDAANLPTVVTYPEVDYIRPDGSIGRDSRIVTTIYDLNRNVEEVHDAEGRKTVNTYTAHNELETSTVLTSLTGDSITNRYEYDKAGNRTLVEDGELRQTSFVYDGLNRNTLVDYGGTNQVRFSYDGVNKTGRTDGNDVLTRYTYDDRHRLDQIFYTKPGAQEEPAYDYDYDDVGNLTSVRDIRKGQSAQVEYRYDELNHVIKERSQDIWHEYFYDITGRRIKALYGSLGGGVRRRTDTGYDALGRVKTIAEREGGTTVTATRTTSYKYDQNGNVVWQELPNGVETSQGFDELNRVTLQRSERIEPNDLRLLISSSAQKYDFVGNVRRIQETRGQDMLGVADVVTHLSYDLSNRLKTERRTLASDGSLQHQVTFGYDKANNCVTRTYGELPSSQQEILAHNDFNQVASISNLDASVTTYDYDNNGNRTSRTGGGYDTTYVYDEENRLVELEENGSSAQVWLYGYDYRSRRISRTSGAVNGSETRIVFSGGTSVAELVPTVPSGGGTPVWDVRAEFVRGVDRGGGVGGLLYSLRDAGTTMRFSHYNGRGDVVSQTDDSGVAQWQASYEAFGTHERQAGTNRDSQRANTKEEDPTGLLNEGFRYRDLATGTFITRDPAGFVDGPNLYTYVRQNPWSKFDPEGLFSWDETRDFVVGTVVGGMEGISGKHAGPSPSTASANGRTFGRSAAGMAGAYFTAKGTVDMAAGGAQVAGGVAAAPATGGISLAASVRGSAQAVVGAVEVTAGVIVLNNVSNLGPVTTSGGSSPEGSAKQTKAVQEGEVGTHGDLQSRSVPGDGLDIHEVPSAAAQIAAKEAELGRKLTPQELKALKSENPSIAIRRETHRLTDTYKGRNKPQKIAQDASDRSAAAERGAQDVIQAGDQTGVDLRESAQKLREMTK